MSPFAFRSAPAAPFTKQKPRPRFGACRSLWHAPALVATTRRTGLVAALLAGLAGDPVEAQVVLAEQATKLTATSAAAEESSPPRQATDEVTPPAKDAAKGPAPSRDLWMGQRDVVAQHIASLSDSRLRRALEHAASFVGTPYVWGADDPATELGFDCGGFIYRIFHDAGLDYPPQRWSTMNMTPLPRGKPVPKLWWTAYSPDFARLMDDCHALPAADGDVIVYHRLSEGQVVDRTGHVVLVVNAARGLALSAAVGGTRLHALGDFQKFDQKSRTACWRARNAHLAPAPRPKITLSVDLDKGRGTLRDPYVASHPLDFTIAIAAANVPATSLRVAVLGRALALISEVHPELTPLPQVEKTSLGGPAPSLARFQLRHDFRQADLPVDPGTQLSSPLRKLVARIANDQGVVLGEKTFYVRLTPYWH